MPLTSDDRKFLELAYEEAQDGLNEGGIPIGSVLVENGEIWGRGHNRRVQDGDPVAHAEIDCIKQAGRRKMYDGTTLYSSAPPCFLCSGAIVMLGIPRVVAVNTKILPGPTAFLESQGVELIDAHHEGCMSILDDFVVRERELVLEDGGAYTRRLLGDQ